MDCRLGSWAFVVSLFLTAAVALPDHPGWEYVAGLAKLFEADCWIVRQWAKEVGGEEA